LTARAPPSASPHESDHAQRRLRASAGRRRADHPQRARVLTKPRLSSLARAFALSVPAKGSKDELLDAMVAGSALPFASLLSWMTRDELKAACRLHGLDDSGRARTVLGGRIVQARQDVVTVPPKRIFDPAAPLRDVPARGSIVHARHRQYLVEDVLPPPAEGHATLVKMVCLDDDAQGRPLELLWELELGARIANEERLPAPARFDAPRELGAYLNAVKWNCVTATDARLFQAPFRAGIKVMHYQLAPLRKR
jgi:hypothetical protein